MSGLIGIPAGAIRALLAGDSMTREQSKADIQAHGLASVCDCAERLRRAGVTMPQLNAAGLTLQCVRHPYVQGATRVATEPELETYRLVHGRSAHPLCTGKTCPSGLRPLTYPNACDAAQALAWTVRLRELLDDPIKGRISDETPVVCPPVIVGSSVNGDAGAPGTIDPNSHGDRPNTRRGRALEAGEIAKARPASVPSGWRDWCAARDSIGAGFAAMIAALKRSEIPVNDVSDKIAAWAVQTAETLGSDIASVTPDHFNLALIRVGSMVVPTETDAGRALINRLKVRKIVIDPTVGVKVTKLNDDGTYNIELGEGKSLTVAKDSVKRAPPTATPKPPTQWMPRVGETAIYCPADVEGGERFEVFVASLDRTSGKYTVEYTMDGDDDVIVLDDVTAAELAEPPSETA